MKEKPGSLKQNLAVYVILLRYLQGTMSFKNKYDVLKSYVDEELYKLKHIHSDNPKLYEPLSYMIELGGKRLRPVLTLAACESFGGRAEHAINPAMGIEVFHNFSLIHDDIMDNAPIRRGKPTVHEKWGVNMGILSGDLLLIKSYELISAVHPAVLAKVFKIFNQTAIQVCEGQQKDMDFEKRELVTEEEYLRMILLKTGVLLGAALQIGALAGGANELDSKSMYEFGCEIGVAFQIKDDWLDSFGEEEKVGKRIGGDIVEGKKTMLMIKAKELANDLQSKKIYKLYSNGATEEQRISGVLEVFDELNIKDICKAEIYKHYQVALLKLESVNMTPEYKNFFREFAEYLIDRDF